MNFASFSDFISMGGHGLYVWLCYGVSLVVFLLIAIVPVEQRKSVIRQLAQVQRRQESRKKEGGSEDGNEP